MEIGGKKEVARKGFSGKSHVGDALKRAKQLPLEKGSFSLGDGARSQKEV